MPNPKKNSNKLFTTSKRFASVSQLIKEDRASKTKIPFRSPELIKEDRASKTKIPFRSPGILISNFDNKSSQENSFAKVKLNDKRKIRGTTGLPLDPNRDKLDSSYNANLLSDVVRGAKKNMLDPYTMVAIAIAETNLGKTDSNIGHTLKNKDQTSAFNKNYDPVQNMMSAYKRQQKLAKGNTEADKIQAYNGYGIVTPKTEANYHGFDMQSIYGVPIPKEGINMKTNPLYGKNIIDIRDNILKNSPEIKNLIDTTKVREVPYKYTEGGAKEPYYTNDPNDPRIQAYRDSSDKFMNSYNELQKVKKQVKQNIGAFSYRADKYLTDSEKVAIKTAQATKQRYDYKPQFTGTNPSLYGFGGTVGNILSTASPFLSMIPGAGAIAAPLAGSMIPGAGAIAAPLAGIAGKILQDTDQPQQQFVQQPRQQYIQRQPMNNYGGQGYALGGRMINEGNGIEHAYGPSHEQGGIQYDQQSEIEGGEKVLNGNYVLTNQPNSNLDKTQMSISRRFDKDHKAISDRNPRSNSDKAKEFLKQDAMRKNDIYLQARHQKMMDKIGKIAKKYGYGGDLESLSAELGVYKEGGGIHIKPSHEGRFTAYKERTGKTTEEALHSLDPHVRQMANFARNAAKWHHADGGQMYTYGGEKDDFNIPISPQDQFRERKRLINNQQRTISQNNNVNRQVQKPHALADVPDYMNPVSNVSVNNQRVIPQEQQQFGPYRGQENSLYGPVNSGNNSIDGSSYRGYAQAPQGRQPDPNSPYVQHGNQTPWSMDAPPPKQEQGASFGRIAETIGTYAPGIYNLARGLFDKTDQMNASDYMIPQQSPYLIPTQTGEGEIRDAYNRGLYDMRGSGTYSKLGQVNLTNQRAKNNYERKLQIMGANAQIRNQTASQNSNINAQNAQMRQGVYDWNARSRAQKGNFVGQGISDLSTGIQNERNYRNDLAGIDMVFDNPTTKNYIEYLRSGRRQPRTK